MNQHLRHEHDAQRVRSTFPRAVIQNPNHQASTVTEARPAGRHARDRTPLTRADARRRRTATLLRFGAVGASGILVNQLVLWGWVAGAGRHYLLGAVVATQASTTWNFCLTERWVFPGGDDRRLASRLGLFLLLNNSTLLLRVPALALLTAILGINYLVSNFITLVVLFLLRFLVSDRLIWKPAAPAAAHPAPARWPLSGARDPVCDGLELAKSERRLDEGSLKRLSSIALVRALLSCLSQYGWTCLLRASIRQRGTRLVPPR